VLPSSSDQATAALRDGIPDWNAAIGQSPMTFPGKVMYLPVASSLELDGGYTNWLPPPGRVSAPPSQWVRVRTTDGVHLCPPGITRYAAPVLADLTTLFHLSPAEPNWWAGYGITVRALTYQSSSLAVACPYDHPPT
jgi:hypothetical protein